jgi:hypothetical protein
MTVDDADGKKVMVYQVDPGVNDQVDDAAEKGMMVDQVDPEVNDQVDDGLICQVDPGVNDQVDDGLICQGDPDVHGLICHPQYYYSLLQDYGWMSWRKSGLEPIDLDFDEPTFPLHLHYASPCLSSHCFKGIGGCEFRLYNIFTNHVMVLFLNIDQSQFLTYSHIDQSRFFIHILTNRVKVLYSNIDQSQAFNHILTNHRPSFTYLPITGLHSNMDQSKALKQRRGYCWPTHCYLL